MFGSFVKVAYYEVTTCPVKANNNEYACLLLVVVRCAVQKLLFFIVLIHLYCS
jgi:hypothetical protein